MPKPDININNQVSKTDTILITQIRMKANHHKDLVKWNEETTQKLENFPGYISQTVTPPNPTEQLNWIVLQHFTDINSGKLWLNSPERHKLVKFLTPFLANVDAIYLIDKNNQSPSAITAMISTKIRAKDQAKFLEWNAQIAMTVSTYPGFLAAKLENYPTDDPDEWLTLVTFDSNENLELWLKSTERIKLMNEVKAFSKDNHIDTIHGGFGSWFKNGSSSERSVWKESMIVLLALYPIGILFGYSQNALIAQGIPFWFMIFLGNALSTGILGYIAVPLLSRWFKWWLNPPIELKKKYTVIGTIAIIILYSISLFIAWKLNITE